MIIDNKDEYYSESDTYIILISPTALYIIMATGNSPVKCIFFSPRHTPLPLGAHPTIPTAESIVTTAVETVQSLIIELYSSVYDIILSLKHFPFQMYIIYIVIIITFYFIQTDITRGLPITIFRNISV